MGADAKIVPLLRLLPSPCKDYPTSVLRTIKVRPLTGGEAEEMGVLGDEWVAHRVATGDLLPRSSSSINSMLKTLRVCRGSTLEEMFSPEQLAIWQESTGHYSPAYRAHMLSTIGQFCRWLVQKDLLPGDPTLHLVKVRQPRSVPRALTSDQAKQVLDLTMNLRDRAIIVLMLQMGLRCVEVVRLDFVDWDQEAHSLFVTGKGGHERVIPVTRRAELELGSYVTHVRGDDPGPLIKGYSPRSPADGRVTATWLSTHISRLMTAAGVHEKGDRRTAHALRHTAASDVLDRSKDLRVVQAMLGHQSLASTEIYLRRADLDKLREAMEGRDYTMEAG